MPKASRIGWLIGAVCGALLWTGSVGLVAALARDTVQPRFEPTVPLDTSQVVISTPAEDDPSWDCHTMGNHICGPIR